MRKQEQIEGMATELSNSSDKHGYDLKECEIDLLALDLYNAGYHKVPDNAVVLTGRELADRTGEIWRQAQEQARKETAKEILSDLLDLHNIVQDINQKTDFYYSIEQLIAEIEIKYDIEVEEL